MVTEPGPAVGDGKDWTWTTERACPDCGFDPAGVTGADLGRALRESSDRWQRVLARTDVRQRPRPGIWSPLEYACHVRDVHRLFTERVALMLAEQDPEFADWDQDEAAVAERYWEQDPAAVGADLDRAGEATAAGYDAVPPDAWARTGGRGSVTFTVLSLGRYHLHDVTHHLYDVQG